MPNAMKYLVLSCLLGVLGALGAAEKSADLWVIVHDTEQTIPDRRKALLDLSETVAAKPRLHMAQVIRVLASPGAAEDLVLPAYGMVLRNPEAGFRAYAVQIEKEPSLTLIDRIPVLIDRSRMLGVKPVVYDPLWVSLVVLGRRADPLALEAAWHLVTFFGDNESVLRKMQGVLSNPVVRQSLRASALASQLLKKEGLPRSLKQLCEAIEAEYYQNAAVSMAMYEDDYEAVRKHLDAGSSPNARFYATPESPTLLQMAIMDKDLPMVQDLVQRGADVNLGYASDAEMTPLTMAKGLGADGADIVAFLEEKGAKMGHNVDAQGRIIVTRPLDLGFQRNPE